MSIGFSWIDFRLAGRMLVRYPGLTLVSVLGMAVGIAIATATFTNETASGWQQVDFGAPVAIAANTTLRAPAGSTPMPTRTSVGSGEPVTKPSSWASPARSAGCGWS